MRQVVADRNKAMSRILSLMVVLMLRKRVMSLKIVLIVQKSEP